MRRKDREVIDFGAIVDIISRCDTLRLGVNGEGYPYVVPLSFGYEVAGGNVVLYFHGAKEGLKHTLIARDNRVCAELSIFHKYTHLAQQNSVTTEYESVIGFGRAVIVSGAEAVHGLDLICEHAGFKGFDFEGETHLHLISVYKIDLETLTAKRRIV